MTNTDPPVQLSTMINTPKWFPSKTVKWIVKHVLPPVATSLLTLIAVFVLILNNRADLNVWHLADLKEEFTTRSDADTFADYLSIEDALFEELDKRVYAKVDEASDSDISRFTRGSQSDPERWDRNWNRTFVLDAEEPNAAVLLIHGMSDSPYSMRNLALKLHEQGASVVGLRVPGHGTAPSGLTHVHWKDMTAAVRLAMQHVSEQAGDKPIIIIGYSNGGALAMEYALNTLDDPELTKPDGVVLISPAIGVTKLAAFAVWQGRLGRITTLDKLAWNSIGLEYDPFKYGSFAVNAGDVTYRLTVRIQNRINTLKASGKLDELPPILAFSSALDATVSTRALVDRLFMRLPPGGHELVVFDINRNATVKSILTNDPDPHIETLLDNTGLSFTLRLLTNRSPSSKDLMLRSRVPGKEERNKNLPFSWPDGVYSLSHIALPFPESDPLYGRIPSDLNPGIQLGSMEMRGERNMTRISASSVLRLHWNPFYYYLEDRVVKFVANPPVHDTGDAPK